MTTNKFSKYVIDNIVVGTPISSIIAAGATIGLDSAAVIDLIDSDYIQQRESSGLDSAEVIALIDSDYVAARTPASNGAGLDSAATLDLLSYGIQNVGSNQKQVAISLNTFVDPFDQTGTADRSFNLNYTSTTGMFVRETGGRTEIHADASGTGQSTGLLLTGASFGNNGTEIAGNLKLSSLPTSDPSESGLLWNDGGIPVFSGSTAPIVSESLDSADVVGIVDSAYVQARETPQDFAYSSLTGAPTALSSFTNDTNYITAADIPATVDSDYVAARAPAASGGLEGFDVSQYDSATSNGIFEYNVSPGNQLRHLYSLNDAVSPTAYDGSLEHQVSWTISSNQQFGFRDVGGFRTKVNALANGSTATTGLVLEGETFNNSGVELVGNVKLSSLPTSDPSETGLLWNDGGIPVFSGSTAPTGGGGGLDSAGVQGIVNDNILGGLADTGVVIGPSVSAASNRLQQTVVGPSAFSDAQYTVVMGRNARVESNFFQQAQESVAIGNFSRVGSSNGGYQSIAIGSSATSEKSYAVTIGANAVTEGDYGVALGYQASAGEDDAIAIGKSATSSQADTIAMGTSSVASGSRSVAIGNGTDATGSSSIALGNSAQALATNAIAIGVSADTNVNTDGIAIGSNTEVSGTQGISIGQTAAASQASVAIGSNASVTTGTESIAIGPFAGATGNASLALGRGAKANANNTIALAATGANSIVATQFGIDIRTSAAGSLTYDTTNDWTFGAGVTMTDLVASGATVVFSNLPTADPVNAGQLWNDAGTMKISAG